MELLVILIYKIWSYGTVEDFLWTSVGGKSQMTLPRSFAFRSKG